MCNRYAYKYMMENVMYIWIEYVTADPKLYMHLSGQILDFQMGSFAADGIPKLVAHKHHQMLGIISDDAVPGFSGCQFLFVLESFVPSNFLGWVI